MDTARVGPMLVLLLPSLVGAQEVIGPAGGDGHVPPLIEQMAREAVDRGDVPALSIVMISDQEIAWSAAFGFADRKAKIAATADSVFRVGSVSKLFTDLAAMQLVEQGKLNLDAPVSTYLPDFKPRNPHDRPITLRQLMSHRSGLVRESPVGHYFDPTGPSIEATVASLNETDLVFEPEVRTSYSNAGVTVIGRLVEVVSGRPFAEYVQDNVIGRCGMTHASFHPTASVEERLAEAEMWSYDGRSFDPPRFALGTLPAGNLYASALDLARFVSMLFADGEGKNGRVVSAETLKSMFIPQFLPADAMNGFGLGFQIGEVEGQKTVGHGGAVYGYSTQVIAIPEKKLGVVVIASRDCANGLVNSIARAALQVQTLQGMGDPIDPRLRITDAAKLRLLEGRYVDDEGGFDVWLQQGKLYSLPLRGGVRNELMPYADGTVFINGLIQQPSYHMKHREDGLLAQLEWRNDHYEEVRDFNRVEVPRPEPVPEAWTGLIGEYGWPHNVLYILERDGKLHALIEWFFLYPLEDLGADVFAFPNWGLYPGEKLVFQRDASGRASDVVAASVRFERRAIPGEDGATYQIKPIRPVEELRAGASNAEPPVEAGEFRSADLVELTSLDPSIRLDIRYATDNNFMGAPFYTQPRAFLQRPAAEALVRVHRSLEANGFGLLIHDAYRPWSVTKMFWDGTSGSDRDFVANPSSGSKHNRGCAVDLSLFDLASGEPVEMVGGYDEFSDRAAAFYPGGTSRQRWHREILRRAMEAEGFAVIRNEWWHFDYQDWRMYGIANQPFEALGAPDR